jgi:hypothetical protein
MRPSWQYPGYRNCNPIARIKCGSRDLVCRRKPAVHFALTRAVRRWCRWLFQSRWRRTIAITEEPMLTSVRPTGQHLLDGRP